MNNEEIYRNAIINQDKFGLMDVIHYILPVVNFIILIVLLILILFILLKINKK